MERSHEGEGECLCVNLYMNRGMNEIVLLDRTPDVAAAISTNATSTQNLEQDSLPVYSISRVMKGVYTEKYETFELATCNISPDTQYPHRCCTVSVQRSLFTGGMIWFKL